MYLTREPIHVYDVIASPPGPSLRGAEGDEAISEIASASFGTPPRNDETSCFPGASVLFLGIVRDHSNGRKVISLEYEAYEEMAERMLAELVTRAFRDWPVEEVRLLHRLGPVHLGEIAVAIAVESVHRDEAYAASRFLIEEIKHRIPIWKKEYFTDGSSEWSQCPAVIARRPPKKRGQSPKGTVPRYDRHCGPRKRSDVLRHPEQPQAAKDLRSFGPPRSSPLGSALRMTIQASQ